MVNPAALSALAKGDIENFITASTPGGIEAQEAAGQQEFVKGESLPKEMSPSREAFEKVGFQFGQDIDELFLTARLPEGWSKKATDHSMHSDIVDGQGRVRVNIFYKAAFYDQRADARLICRFKPHWLFNSTPLGKDLAADEMMVAVVDASKETLFSSSPFKKDDYEMSREWDKKAQAWLDEHYPENKDPTAYWQD